MFWLVSCLKKQSSGKLCFWSKSGPWESSPQSPRTARESFPEANCAAGRGEGGLAPMPWRCSYVEGFTIFAREAEAWAAAASETARCR